MLFKKENIPEKKAPAPNTRYAQIIFDDKVIENAYLSMASFRFEPGQIGPEHYHDTEVEVYYCLKGKGSVTIDGEENILEPGSALYIPPNVKHETKNIGDEDFEFLGIFAPCMNFDNIRQW